MRALRYFIAEAGASLWRGRQAAALAVLTIAAGLFVLGFFLVVHTNLQQLTARWAETAELAVYLRDEATPEQVRAVETRIAESGVAAAFVHVSKAQAAERFAQDFPDLGAATARLGHNPFPASIDVRLRPDARDAEEAVGGLAAALAADPAVADVRYDRQWLNRLHTIVRVVRVIGLVILAMLAIAAALTVANVVRLAAHARRHEIEIMKLVGAPFTYVRGPLVAEGVIQGGAGALVAIAALIALATAAGAWLGAEAGDLPGAGTVRLFSAGLALTLLLAGMVLGCIGGLIVARSVR